MSKKILIADDEPNIVRLIASRLAVNNYEVIIAYDGFFAVKEAHEKKPDLILLDIRMPAGGGFSVLENLKSTGDTMMIPIIFITAHPTEELRKQALEMGAADFIAKPFDSEELLAKVAKALSKNKKEGNTP